MVHHGGVKSSWRSSSALCSVECEKKIIFRFNLQVKSFWPQAQPDNQKTFFLIELKRLAMKVLLKWIEEPEESGENCWDASILRLLLTNRFKSVKGIVVKALAKTDDEIKLNLVICLVF